MGRKYSLIFNSFMETAHTALLWIYLYNKTVAGFGKFEQLEQIHWSLSVSVPISCIIVLFTEVYYFESIRSSELTVSIGIFCIQDIHSVSS